MLLLIRYLVNKFPSLICYLDLATSVSGKTVEQKLSNSDGSLIRRAVASGHLENRQETVIIYLFFHGVSGKGPIKSTPWCAILPPLQELGGALQKSCQIFLHRERTNIYDIYIE